MVIILEEEKLWIQTCLKNDLVSRPTCEWGYKYIYATYNKQS